MNRIFAIAGLTLRTAVRSRVFVLLAIIVVICIVGLPFIIRSDGTLAGTVQLYLHYALGWAVFLLSMAALWTGAGAFSQEVETGQVQLLVTKPIHSFNLWFGKWLGLMAMNVVLLGLAGALAYGMLRWTTRPANLSPEDRQTLREEILTARSKIVPAPVPALCAETTDQEPARGSLMVVAPGGRLHWQFTLPPCVRRSDTVLVQYRFATSRVAETSPVEALWMIGPEYEPDRCKVLTADAPNISHRFRIPAGVLAPDEILTLTYCNINSARPAHLVFSASDGVEILVREGGFELNLVRALLVVLARLSFFSALGLTAGAFFSFPVAAFTSFALLLMTGFSRFIESAASDVLNAMQGVRVPETVSVRSLMFSNIFLMLDVIVPPLWRFDPLEILSSGGMISCDYVANAFVVLVGLHAGILALLGAWLFNRRELGLPSL